ncbi:hypothetical protein V5799_010962 [Amblyomma americanum]|uniref:Tick transposon n=1 Tax=Amblyomma americanum TaxID=6943 RepID=A0AAQ4EI98_AMBAM
MSPRGKYRTLSVKEKLAVIEEVEAGAKKTSVALKYGITKSTLTTIVKAKDKLRNNAGHFAPDRKRLREAAHPELEKAVFLWLKRARSCSLPVSGPILREKAEQLSLRFGIEDFKCSDGWVSRFKERHGLTFKTVSGEAAAVDEAVTTDWQQTRLQSLLLEYSPADIYNADEMGLFFKCLPQQTLCRKGERCTGGKLSKERLTVMVCANMDGSHKPELFVVGKSKRPRCFKGVRTLPVSYAANTRAWMTQSLFEDWLRKLDVRFKRDKRKVLMIVDNCPAHGDVEGLEAIRLEFLPPNTTAVLQPLDQGVIKCLKMNYRKLLLKRMLICMDNSMSYSVTLLSSVGMLADAWSAVTSATIRNCFQHAFRIPGHTSDTLPDCARNEGEDCLQMESDEARLVLSALQAHNIAADLGEFAAADDNLCVCREDTLDDLVAEVLPAQYSSESEEESEEQSSVTAAQAFHYLAEVRKFLTVEENSQEQLAALNGIENFVLNAHVKKKQSTIHDFFKRSSQP